MVLVLYDKTGQPGAYSDNGESSLPQRGQDFALAVENAGLKVARSRRAGVVGALLRHRTCGGTRSVGSPIQHSVSRCDSALSVPRPLAEPLDVSQHNGPSAGRNLPGS